MFRLMRFRPSPAMVVACTALLISLGGVGYSAIRLPANSVTTKCLGGRADCMVRCLSPTEASTPLHLVHVASSTHSMGLRIGSAN